MDERQREWTRQDWRRLFPWLHLFRAFGIACDFRKLLLAALASLMHVGGNRLMAMLPFAPDYASAGRVDVWPWESGLGFSWQFSSLSGGPPALTELQGLFSAPGIVSRWDILSGLGGNWHVLLAPIASVLGPVLTLLSPDVDARSTAFALTQLFWALAVWSVFAGAITRMAAVEFALDERIRMKSALKYSLRRFLSYFTAPLLPLLGLLLLWLLCALAGFLARVPVAGAIVVGLFWFVALFFGFLMALLLIGTIAGWPLMFATVSTEGSDAFDGLSRAFSYIFDRPWYALWLAALTVVYGSLSLYFVALLAELLTYLAAHATASGWGRDLSVVLGAARNAELADGSPMLLLARFWRNAIGLLVFGFLHSFFWTAATIIYALLRKSDDATELDHVLPPDENNDELLQLVGPEVETAQAAASVPDAAASPASAPPPPGNNQ